MPSSLGVVHVFPENDIFPHRTNEQPCSCHPVKIEITSDNGIAILGHIVVHKAWDRREIYEKLKLLWPTYKGFSSHA